MRFLVQIFNIGLLLTIVVSCGKSAPSEEENLFADATKELNSRNYPEAKDLFTKLSQRFPNNRKYQELLADSYLGLGGFELFDFLISIEKILSTSFESEEILKETKKFVDKYIHIKKEKKDFLEKALRIYYKLESTQANTREDKLKKGLVHIFLLTQSLKDLILESSGSEFTNDEQYWKDQYKKFVAKYIVHIDEMIYHSFNAYINFKESFSEIEILFKELDRAILSVFGIPYNSIKGELRNLSLEKLIGLFIKNNPQLHKKVMLTAFQTCSRSEIEKRIKIFKQLIIDEHSDTKFQGSVLRFIAEVEKNVTRLDENICSSDT